MKTADKTNFGTQIIGDSLEVLKSYPDNSIDLVMTSPPFALLRKNMVMKINTNMLNG